MSTQTPPPYQSNWYLLTGLLLGLGLGLVYAWVLSPVRFVDTSPASLRSDFKDQYRLLIAITYQDSGDLTRARSRLALLGDPDPVTTLTNQAQRLLLAGDTTNSASPLAILAQAIQQNQAATSSPEPTGLSLTTPPSTNPTGVASTGLIPTLPSRPTMTPTSTPGAPFALLVRENVCNAGLPGGLLQVEVRNASGGPVPGAELVISWSSGEEHFFTGLKPELGNGYADYRMTPGITYILQLATNSVAVPGLTDPSCPGEAGKTFWGGIHLVFQQPEK
jgi:hypothetical protein